jgi:hypothetical protein
MPAGHGYGIVNVAANGMTTFNGRLADNTAYTAGTIVRNDSSMALYLKLPAGQRCYADVQFLSTPTEDFQAEMAWQNPALAIDGIVALHGARVADAPIGLPLTVSNLHIDGETFARYNIIGNTWYFGTLGLPVVTKATRVNAYGLFRGTRNAVPYYWIPQAKRGQGFGFKVNDRSAITITP